MQIVVDKFGAFIGKTENRFQIKNKDKKEEYSADIVSQILNEIPPVWNWWNFRNN